MIEKRRQRLCRARIGSLSRMICLSILIAVAGLSIGSETTQAQYGPVLTVTAEPTMLRAGEWIAFTVEASGMGYSAQIRVDVPNALEISEQVQCVHNSATCDPPSIAPGDAGTTSLSVRTPGSEPDMFGDISSSPSKIASVTVTFSVFVPPDVPAGSRFNIDTYVDGLFTFNTDPGTLEGRFVSTAVEVLKASGQRVPPPSPPTPTPAPALNTVHTMRFDIRQGDVLPVTFLVPGENYNFTVLQGFMSVAGFYSLTITIPNGLTILGEPECNVADAGSCSKPEVKVNASGATSVQIVGEITIADPVSLDFGVMVSSSVAIEIPIEITGRYSVTDASTHMEYQSDLWSPLYLTDLDTALASATQVGTVRVTFEESGEFTDELGACVALSQDGRWTSQYFVCDNDTAAAEPTISGSAILSDSSPIADEIVVSVTTGTYYVTVESMPAGFDPESTDAPGMVSVSSDGAELTIDLLSP